MKHLMKCAGHQAPAGAYEGQQLWRAVHYSTMSCWLLSCQMHNMQPRGVHTPPTLMHATRSNLDSWWELNIRPQHLGKRTSVFIYSLVILSIKLCKVWYINLRLHGLLMHLMWVSCDCVHWCEYEPFNKVCDSKREYARGHFNIFRANFIFRFYVFR